MTKRIRRGGNSEDFQFMFLGDVDTDGGESLVDGSLLAWDETSEKFKPAANISAALAAATSPSAANAYLTSLFATQGVSYSISTNHATFNGTVDDALSIAYNLTPGTAATRIDGAKHCINMTIESDWNDGTTHWTECGFRYIGADGTVRRPYGNYINLATHNITLELKTGADALLLYSKNGYATFGANVDSNSAFDVVPTKTGSSYQYGLWFIPTVESTDQHAYGLHNSPNLMPATNKWGISADFGAVITSPSGETQTAAALYVSSMSKSGTGTIDKVYGLYMESQSIGAINYSIYAGGLSRVGDNIGVGSDPLDGSVITANGVLNVTGYAYALDFKPTITATNHAYGVMISPTVTIPTGKVFVGEYVGATRVTYASGGNGDAYLLWIANVAAKTGTMNTQYGLYIENLTQGTVNYAIHTNGGKIHFGSLPTSAAGLSAGDVWNDGGVLTIV
jgi:hypothetical protein